MILHRTDFSALRYWLDMTTIEAAALPKDTVALLPVTAVEQHGPHLPLGTDAFINRGIIARMLEVLPHDVPLLILPEQTVGASSEHLDFAGSLSHQPGRLMEIWSDVLACVRTTKIRRLLIFNSHGGQTGLLSSVAIDLRVRFGFFVTYASWFDANIPDGLFAPEEMRYGIHGGAIETSLMLHLRPDLVRQTLSQNFPSRAVELDQATYKISANSGDGRLGGFGWKAQDLQKNGVTGDASAATAEIGKILLEHLARQLVELAIEISTAAELIDNQ